MEGALSAFREVRCTDRYDGAMEDPTIPPGLGPEAHREFVARMRAAAAAEDAEARAAEWRNRTPEEHGAALVRVLRLSAAIQRSRPQPAEREPLLLPEALRLHAVRHGRLPPREGDPVPER